MGAEGRRFESCLPDHFVSLATASIRVGVGRFVAADIDVDIDVADLVLHRVRGVPDIIGDVPGDGPGLV